MNLGDLLKSKGGCALHETDCFETCLKKIEASKYGVGFVFDSEQQGQVTGTITLGDLRRTKAKSGQGVLASAMRADFVSVQEGQILSFVDLLMIDDCGIKLVPVLKDGLMVDVLNVSHALVEKIHNFRYLGLKQPLQNITKVVRLPARVSLAGGGLDYSINMLRGPVEFVSFPISQFCEVSLRLKSAKHSTSSLRITCAGRKVCCERNIENIYDIAGFELIKSVFMVIGSGYAVDLAIDVDWEIGSGLGGSSVVVLALLQAFAELLNLEISADDLIGMAYYCERHLCEIAGGWQDFFPAVHGAGLHSLALGHYHKLDVNVSALQAKLGSLLLKMPPRPTATKSAHFLYPERQKMQIANGVRVRTNEVCRQMSECIAQVNAPAFLESIRIDWHRKLEKNSDDSAVLQADKILRWLSAQCGDVSGKLLGGGGGGNIFVMWDKSTVSRISPPEILSTSEYADIICPVELINRRLEQPDD